MRKFLLISLILLVLAVAATLAVAHVSGRPQLVLVAVVPAALFVPLLVVYGVVAATFNRETTTSRDGGCSATIEF